MSLEGILVYYSPKVAKIRIFILANVNEIHLTHRRCSDFSKKNLTASFLNLNKVNDIIKHMDEEKGLLPKTKWGKILN